MYNNNQPLIIFTGGGSAGHVTPNLALIKRCLENHWRVVYIGSENGIEKQIIAAEDIPYYEIKTGKLRRYLSWRNFLDPFKVLYGIFQSIFICRRLRPQVVFSKGGFVAFPVVFGAWCNRIPVICHESDLTPGFANRLSFPFAKQVCLTFAETQKYFKNPAKTLVTGTPVRESLFHGDADSGRKLCGFTQEKPIILATGGGLGADAINCAIRAALPQLLQNFQIIHLCGKNKTDAKFDNIAGYKQFDYVNAEMADFLACADLVISRAGANVIYELIALRKPNLLIPLTKKASRGDQLINARYCERQHLSAVLYEEDLTKDTLISAINTLLTKKAEYIQTLREFKSPDSIGIIYDRLTKI